MMCKKSKLIITFIVAFPLIITSACNGSPGPTSTQKKTALNASQETAAEEPISNDQGLVLLDDHTFIQDETTLVTVFLLQNTAPQSTLEDVKYTVYAYNASGAQVGNDTGYIQFFFPNQIIGVVNEIWLDEGVSVDSVSVDCIIGDTNVYNDFDYPFVVENSKYYSGDSGNYITGVIKNNADQIYTDLRVNAVAYNANDLVIGGGYTYVDFIPNKDQVGVSVRATLLEEPTRVELYPIFSAFSMPIDDGKWRNNIELTNFGFIQDGTEVGGGFLIKNVSNQILVNSQYYITIYDADGYVCAAESGYIDLLWPGETLGYSPGSIFIPEQSKPSKVDVIILPGEFGEHELTANPLTVENVKFVEHDDWPSVTATLVNSLDQSITNPEVYVLLYNADGEIVGGGISYPDDLAAKGSMEIEIFVIWIAEGAPAKIEVYPTITSWSELGQ